jgi:hypothetical protein
VGKKREKKKKKTNIKVAREADLKYLLNKYSELAPHSFRNTERPTVTAQPPSSPSSLLLFLFPSPPPQKSTAPSI